MKLAFVDIPVDAEQFKSAIPEVEDAAAFDDIWKALGYLGGTGTLVINRERAGDLTIPLRAAGSSGVYIYETTDIVPSMDDPAVLRTWAGIPAPAVDHDSEPLPTPMSEEVDPVAVDDEDYNPMADILSEDTWENDIEEVDDSYNDEIATNFRNLDVTPAVVPVRHEERVEEVVGLNKKIQITPDMMRMEERKKDGRTPYNPSDLGYLMLVTSGFGGGGKTTISYYAAHVMGMALKHAKNDRTKVILIEGDYGNPKLQNRLRIPVGQDLSKLANFLDAVKRGEIAPGDVNTMAEQIMEDIIFEDLATGVKVIACPYNKAAAAPPAIREALKKAVMWAQRSMGYFVILDADTIGLAEGVELDLLEMANRVVIITNTREPKVIKKKFLWRKEEVEAVNPNDRSHIDDALMMIRVFTRPISQNGFGIPGNRIRVLFNETSAEELTNKVLKKEVFPKNMVVGNLPKIPEIERSWAADVNRNRNRAIEVAKSVAEFMLRTTEYRELDQLLKAMRAG